MTPEDRRKIQNAITFAHQLADVIEGNGINRERLLSDRLIQWAVTTPLLNIGEFTAHVSKELRAAHPDIPWSKVIGLRHRLVHDYGGTKTKWTIIADVVFRDLPSFVQQLEALLAEG